MCLGVGRDGGIYEGVCMRAKSCVSLWLCTARATRPSSFRRGGVSFGGWGYMVRGGSTAGYFQVQLSVIGVKLCSKSYHEVAISNGDMGEI